MIYLDSAATTLQKPRTVPTAVAKAISGFASPGRGGYQAGSRAERMLFQCRETAAGMFRVPSPEQVVLTSNATHGLNIAIRTLVKPGSTVLISGYEHNAVTRTLNNIPGITVRIAKGALFDPDGVYDAFQRSLTSDVSAVICSHVSNVFGFVQPVERIAELCRARGKPLIVDASQSAGVLPVDLEGWGAAFVAMPGHKGLYGPQGTGLLLCGTDASPLICGGTGGMSLVQEMPEFLPDRLEAGTQNVCGAAGLMEGMRFVQKRGQENIRRHEVKLCSEMMDRIGSIPGVRLFRGSGSQSGLFSFSADGADCEVLGETLGKRGVAVRAGLHCAPLAHRSAGTLESGTVRVSFSAFNTESEVETAAKIIRAEIGKMRVR